MKKASIRFAFLFSFFTASLSFYSAAQQTNLDSLYSVWQDETQVDSNRLKAASNLLQDSRWMQQAEISPLSLSDQMYELAVQSGLEKYQSTSLMHKGIIKLQNNELSAAIRYANKCIPLAQKNKYYPDLASAYAIISSAAYKAGEMSKLMSYEKKSLAAWRKTNNNRMIAWSIHNLGYAYQELRNYDEAISSYNESIDFSIKHGIVETQANCLGYLGETYQLKGDYIKAQDYFVRSLNIKKANNLTREIPWTMVKMGEGLIALRSYRQAAEICQQAFDMATPNEDAKRVACKCLSESYKFLGHYKKALHYYERWHTLNDSLQQNETSKLLQQLEFAKQIVADSLEQVAIDLELKNEHDAQIRIKDKNRNIAIGGGLFFLLLAGGLFSRNRFIKRSKDIVEKEKDRSDNLLLNILPAEIAEELKIKGKADARDFNKVSILFTDFKEFTQTSEKLSAQELVAEINTCFEAFDKICEKYKIEKIKTIGDAYMAAGGLPVPSNDSVKNTVLAAIEMQAFMGSNAEGREPKADETKSESEPRTSDLGHRLFEMRVGIHTGPVVAGIVGVKKFQYDIWGDTVNTASRAESESEVGKVNITAATYELIKEDSQFVFEFRGKIDAKGKGEIEMWFVSKRVSN